MPDSWGWIFPLHVLAFAALTILLLALSAEAVRPEIRIRRRRGPGEAPVFGENAAMRPTEMLLGALGGCTGLNAVLLLKKFKQPLKSLAVEVEGEQDKEWPRAFTRIEITFVIGWDGKHDNEQVDSALDMACNRYCPIHATLSRGTKIAHGRKDAH